jgi:8-oxo-dGTP pyrophosphatase MutT (NUDIX family)
MPQGKTESGLKADGSVVIIYYNDLYLMAQETKYLTDSQELSKWFLNIKGESLFDTFLHKGTTENTEDLEKAKHRFALATEQLERIFPEIPRITYADFKNSRTNPGHISAKPRYVAEERRRLFGFPKGSYETKDLTLKHTAARECFEETGIILNIDKLDDKRTLVSTGRGGFYLVYHYKLTKMDYENCINIIRKKNQERENELHNIQFMRIPKGDPRDFFINVVSKEAYEQTVESPKLNIRKTRRNNININYIKRRMDL